MGHKSEFNSLFTRNIDALVPRCFKHRENKIGGHNLQNMNLVRSAGQVKYALRYTSAIPQKSMYWW